MGLGFLRRVELFPYRLAAPKVFESMAMAVRILVTVPDGEAIRIVRDVGAGICVFPEDPDALAQAIRSLADQPHMMSKLWEAAVNAAPRFTRDTGEAQMAHVLESVCAT